jgi:hypothetical protein
MSKVEDRDQSPRRLLGVPYDFRRPTVQRARSRMWNRDDPHLLTPKTFGWGYDVNLYWLTHPAGFVHTRLSGSTGREEPRDT